MRARWLTGVGVLASFFVWLGPGPGSSAQTTSALRVETVGPPQSVHGSDGREHIEYDLVITNSFSADIRLKSLDVRAGGRRLLLLSGAKLGAPTLGLAPSKTVVIPVDLALPRSAGRRVPGALTNRIKYAIPGRPPLRGVIGSTTVHLPPVRLDRHPPVVIASPLRGSGWVNGNGCCADPTSPHRSTVLATSTGGYISPEVFAIDWVREVKGVIFTGDGSKNSDWPTFGAGLYAVANGTVVTAVDGMPDIPPHSQNPSLLTPDDFGGNHVILRIGPGRYACYAHMKRGSVRVRPGQHVRVGQRIGLVGNSGNTTGPHLHFGIQRRADCLSGSEPFEIDRFKLQGMADPNSPEPHVKIVATPRRERRSLPLIFSVSTL